MIIRIRKYGKIVIKKIKAVFKCILHFKTYTSQIRMLNTLYENNSLDGKYIEERKIWYGNFKKLIFYSVGSHDRMPFISAFFTENVELKKQSNTYTDFSMPIVVVAVRNDIPHISVLLKHYRKLGITNFLIIDNDSDDGTLSYLMQQEDVTVYSVKTQFKDYLKNGWKNQVIARMGLNHWYIYVDADELLVYPGMEEISFKEYMERINYHRIKKLNGFVLDMYPEYDLLDKAHPDFDLIKDYCWYDKYDSRYVTYKNNYVWGGMRNRVFGTNSLLAIKRVVFYEKNRFICSSHYIFPFEESDDGNVNIAFLHYKFLPSDINNYRRVADTGIYHNSSNGYRRIMEKFDNSDRINAMCELSCKWSGSDCLKEFPFMQDVSGYWDK